MTCGRSIKKSFRERFTAAPLVCRDGFGDPTYGDKFDFYGRRELRERKILTTDGNFVSIEDLIYTDQELKISDLIWFDGEDTDCVNNGHIVLNVAKGPSLCGDFTLYKVSL